MNKFKFILPIILLAGLVLIGAGCGENGTSDGSGAIKINPDKKLDGATLMGILNQTGNDLGWPNVQATTAGKGYQLKRVYYHDNNKHKETTLAITEVSEAELALILPGANKKNFIKKVCETMPQYDEVKGTSKSKLMKILGFESCNTLQSVKVWKDIKDCSDHSDTMAIIGNYWVQAISNVVDERGGQCGPAVDSIPMAKELIRNLANALQ